MSVTVLLTDSLGVSIRSLKEIQVAPITALTAIQILVEDRPNINVSVQRPFKVQVKILIGPVQQYVLPGYVEDGYALKVLL